MLRYTVEDIGVPGLVAGALDADGSTRVVAYGTGGGDTRPLGPRSVFGIGSVTKTFIGTLLADMAARGEVALDDPVSMYLADGVTVPSRGGREITLLDLATHRSGLPTWARDAGVSDPEEVFADRGVEAMYDFLSAYELEREPGTEYAYSNLGFGLLGHALARTSHRSLPDLVRKRILDPLGMDMTTYAPTGEMAEWVTLGHEPGDVVPIESDALGGAGGLFSNAQDLLTYLEANVGPPRTDLERAMRMAQRARASMDGEGMEVGLAWRTLTAGDGSIVWHTGRHAGYTAFAGFDPERRAGLVLLANTEVLEIGGFGLSVLMTPRAPPEWRGAPVDRSTLREYAGEYRGASGGSLYVRLEDEGWLTYQPPGNARTRLYPRTDSSFYMMRGPWTLTFQRDGGGEVVEMHVAVDEREPTPSRRGTERTVDRVGAGTPPPRAVAAGNVWSSFTIPWRPALAIVVGALLVLALVVAAGRMRRRLP